MIERPAVLTVGHSTHGLDEFIDTLVAHGAVWVADVRRFPASRRYPHFNRENLCLALARRDIDYQWIPELGGRRTPHPDSHNTRWRDHPFRGYADYMETPLFQEAVDRLAAVWRTRTVVLMCAEAMWRRCHRSLISDYLMASGVSVAHIVDARKKEPHCYTEPARVLDGKLSYAEERLI